MKWTSNWVLLASAMAIGCVGVLAASAYGSHTRHQARDLAAHQSAAGVPIQHLAPSIDVAPQLPLQAIAGMRGRGYATVIDLRPDDEDAGQASSRTMARQAKDAGIGFRYVPVPHGDIPDAAVDQLRQELAHAQGEQVLLYCRSGRRAARTWALVEAGRPGGLTVPQILAAVTAAAQDATDLRERLEANLARRSGGANPA